MDSQHASKPAWCHNPLWHHHETCRKRDGLLCRYGTDGKCAYCGDTSRAPMRIVPELVGALKIQF